MKDIRYCPRCRTELEERESGGWPRKVCPAPDCGYVFWNNPVPVVAAIVERNGRVVLGRNREWPEKMFGLITGFLEKDETPEQGVLREVKEELDLSGEVVSLVGLYPAERLNQLIIAYHVRAEGEIRLNEELVEFREIPPEKLMPWPFGTGHAVSDWLARRTADPS